MGEKPDPLRPPHPAESRGRAVLTTSGVSESPSLPTGEGHDLETDDRTASASAEDLRDDIEQSRAQMSDTIDAIQEKLGRTSRAR